jgi:hypothetical protein
MPRRRVAAGRVSAAGAVAGPDRDRAAAAHPQPALYTAPTECNRLSTSTNSRSTALSAA